MKMGAQGERRLSGNSLLSRRSLRFSMLCVCFFLLGAKSEPLLPGEEDPMERREERLALFRQTRDQFFKADPSSPLKEADRKTFKGLIYYPIRLQYAMTGMIERYPMDPKPLYKDLPTNKEKVRKYVKYGRFKFKSERKEYVLQIYRPLGGGELFLPFKDKTSGKETYINGRYLFIEPMAGGRVLIDFNRAYSPFCHFSEKYTCPFATEENDLKLAVEAGEKRFR
jgi:uncharacterized protein